MDVFPVPMRPTGLSFVRAAAFGVLVACGGGPNEATATVPLVGYVHTLAKSWCPIGEPVQPTTIGSLQELIGSHGVFATDEPSEMASASLNAPSTLPAFSGSSDEHNARVLTYFVSSGLPADQVSSVTALQRVISLVGPTSMSPTEMILQTYWQSTFSRAFDGIPIVESFAWAQLAEHDATVAESVYWPEIPSEVFDTVARFQKVLSDANDRTVYLAMLPVPGAGGQLVIHHTPGSWQGQFSAVACFDVAAGSATLHFDIHGASIVLPQER